MTIKIEISKRLVLINSASSVVAKVLNVCVLIWLYQHLLRRISPEEYALYPPLMGVMAFAPTLTNIPSGPDSELTNEHSGRAFREPA